MNTDERLKRFLTAAVLIGGSGLLVACDGRYTPSPAAPDPARAAQTVGGQVTQAAAPLFSADSGSGVTSAPGVLRRRDADVNVGALGLDTLQPASRVLLDLFRDTEYVATFTRVEGAVTGRAWVGAIEGIAGSEVTLAVGNEGVFSGTITVPGAMYSVVSGASGRYVIAQVDQTSFPHPG